MCLAGVAILCLAGCMTVQGISSEPTEHRKVITASAYSLEGCQAKLDESAGRRAEMTEQVSQVGISILSLGLLPSYICRGTVPDAFSSSAKTPQ